VFSEQREGLAEGIGMMEHACRRQDHPCSAHGPPLDDETRRKERPAVVGCGTVEGWPKQRKREVTTSEREPCRPV